MPLYEYKCDKCGDVIEVRQRFSDEPLKVHDNCGGNLERLISRSAFQLKGSGWYATDYAKSSGGAPAKSDSGAGASTATSETKNATTTETKSDAKPAESKPATTDKSKSD
jgi:putative FmdB family regulatory protein